MLDVCSWNSPGHNAFMGDRPSAISSYAIPADIRAKLKTKMLGLQYDDVVEITKHSIEGKHAYINMRNMHFGTGQVCKNVDISGWKPTDKEVGLVYCVEDSCIIVPTVCGNVSQIDRLPERQALKQLQVTDPKETFELQATVPPVAFFSSEENGNLYSLAQPNYWSSYWSVHSVPDMGLSLTGQSFTIEPPPFGYWQPLPPPVYSVPKPGTALDIVTPVPEPGTWILTMLGIAMIGLFKYRRQVSDNICTLCGRTGHRASQCPWGKYKE
jgi:hypothetical protein